QFRNYMDDIRIGTYKGEEELHIQIIKDLLKICHENELHLKLSKSIFLVPEITFLGMNLSSKGVAIDLAKINGITEWPQTLKGKKDLRSFLGVVGYVRAVIPNFAKIAKPLIVR